jgi:RimJ/RimL family protein N-acetyltransferase
VAKQLRAKVENNDPFSGFAVYEAESGKFIGHIVAGGSDEGKGVSEIAYLFHKEYWGKGIGTTVVSALVNCYIPHIMTLGYKIDHGSLKKLVATARTDNIASQEILNTIGFTTDKSETNFKFGTERYITMYG